MIVAAFGYYAYQEYERQKEEETEEVSLVRNRQEEYIVEEPCGCKKDGIDRYRQRQQRRRRRRHRRGQQRQQRRRQRTNDGEGETKEPSWQILGGRATVPIREVVTAATATATTVSNLRTWSNSKITSPAKDNCHYTMERGN